MKRVLISVATFHKSGTRPLQRVTYKYFYVIENKKVESKANLIQNHPFFIHLT